jgi:DNA-binding response OmpR family regulator
VELLLAERPDIALVDIGLPSLDGYEVARQVRAACETRLVALTGYGGDGDRERAAGAGFDAHLVRPVEFEQLTAVLARLARGGRPPPPKEPSRRVRDFEQIDATELLEALPRSAAATSPCGCP